MSTKTRYERVKASVDAACEKAGRAPEEVLVLAVSKTVDIDQVEMAHAAGAVAFGENRPDELLRKKAALPDLSFHFIGNIQSRRIADIVSAADVIHSVCKEAHLAKIDAAARALDKVQPVLIEVNVSGEESKSGFAPVEVRGVIERAAALANVEVRGLMTMAPRADAESIDAAFTGLRRLFDELNAVFEVQGTAPVMSDLSMGMTEDWPVAIPLGATMVRIGRAIFDDSFENV